MLAKATANESKVAFLYSSATEFMEMYVGMGAKRVRELFASANY
jgi:ATP-dependent Zn protease